MAMVNVLDEVNESFGPSGIGGLWGGAGAGWRPGETARRNRPKIEKAIKKTDRTNMAMNHVVLLCDEAIVVQHDCPLLRYTQTCSGDARWINTPDWHRLAMLQDH